MANPPPFPNTLRAADHHGAAAHARTDESGAPDPAGFENLSGIQRLTYRAVQR